MSPCPPITNHLNTYAAWDNYLFELVLTINAENLLVLGFNHVARLRGKDITFNYITYIYRLDS